MIMMCHGRIGQAKWEPPPTGAGGQDTHNRNVFLFFFCFASPDGQLSSGAHRVSALQGNQGVTNEHGRIGEAEWEPRLKEGGILSPQTK